MKKVLKNIIEYLSVFLLLTIACFVINRGIVIKALYMDDLFHWSWYRGINIFEFAFKFYDGSSRYRPVFDAIQYIFYTIIGTNPFRYAVINKVYNSVIALFIYHFIKRFDCNRVIAFIFSIFYLIAHFAYYQIGQGIGALESDALFFAIIIVFYCLKLTGVISGSGKNDILKNTIMLFIMFFVISFTHERYMGLAVPIAISLLMAENKKYKAKNKIISILVFIIEILIICIIRFMAIGKVVPAGTGGTYVEETFNIMQCIKFCFTQIAVIFGINIGPEYLYGIDFVSIESRKIKMLVAISILLIAVVIMTYIYERIKTKNEKKSTSADLIFLSAVAMCIGASSVTIRVEMRFIYISFVLAIIYLTYMGSFLCKRMRIKNASRYIYIVLALIFVTRVPIEFKYRDYFYRIHCYVDLIRVNSIYDSTIGKYGLDDILHNKKIYLINKTYGMTNFYAEYFFKIYDKNDVGNKILLVDDMADIPQEDIGKDTIILYENYENNDYKELVIN